MFIGLYFGSRKIPEEKIVKFCKEYAEAFEDRFGSLRCLELRPNGFNPSNPPHLCESLTCEAIEFSYEFIKKGI